LRIEMRPGFVTLGGEDVTATIRTAEVAAGSSQVAVHAGVRRFLAAEQRRIAWGRDVICEGRDQGTVVFPHAQRQFFLTAAPQTRARRRYKELLARGVSTDYETVLRQQLERDRRDGARDLAPMVPAPDAVQLDTTLLTLDEVVARLEQEIRACR